ncbi:MAG: flagellar biosynthesis protein FlhF [Treponema sp.]|jgi:flagellar biosynthesis protein FlhF|nr:flagellar biosynthesis protein FlhF [Treponema sp.]
MEYQIERGLSRQDCEQKIFQRTQRPFHIVIQRDIRIPRFLGLFSKPGVEVYYYFTSQSNKNPAVNAAANMPFPWHMQDAETKPSQYLQPNFEEEKRKLIAAAGKNYAQINEKGGETAQQILDSLNEIKNEIKEKIDSSGKKEEHPAFTRAQELLRNNDFSQNYISKMLEKMRKELPLEKLDDPDTVQEHLLEWIGETINIYKDDASERKPRIMVLVGPTGVGKTTTIAKLAAIYGIESDENNAPAAVEVRMITIDAYRIGAKDQIEKIGNIMQIPVSCVDNKLALRKEIAMYSEVTDMFLIDTIGKSPKDAAKIGEMKEILEGAGRGAEFHLVISAGIKTSDIEDIMRQFEPFNYKSVIITKMDETDRIGSVISAAAEKRKSISFITDGQTVPVDIRKASVVRFLTNLDGFKVDREKLEKRFPSGDAEQFRWK